MTTIAWDGRTLAADRRAWDGVTIRTVSKLRRLPDGRLFGGCGTFALVQAIGDWLQDGGLVDARPPIPADEDSPEWLEVFPDGSVILHERAGPIRLGCQPTAIGTGGRFAIGAMACGRTAREAVEVAARFDILTGDGVDVLAIEQPGRWQAMCGGLLDRPALAAAQRA